VCRLNRIVSVSCITSVDADVATAHKSCKYPRLYTRNCLRDSLPDRETNELSGGRSFLSIDQKNNVLSLAAGRSSNHLAHNENAAPSSSPPDLWIFTPNLSALRFAARGDLVVPGTRLQLGNRAFCVAGPVAWNSLTLDIRSEPTLSTFKNMLKTRMFSRSYYTD